MKGSILDYSTRSNEGQITTEEGLRFVFSGPNWKDDSIPMRGMLVDFIPKDNIATEVYRALGDRVTSKYDGKSKAAATLWGTFLGCFGAHKFYMGSWGWGIVYLLTCWTYIPFILALIEWIRYVLMTDDEFRKKADEFKINGPKPFGFFW